MASAAASGSTRRPSRSMSAICQRPVTTRLISNPGASVDRGSGGDADAAMALAGSGFRLFADLLDQLVDLRARDLARGGHLSVLDPPKPERTGDVAILVELHRADHADISDRLMLADQRQRLFQLIGAGVDDRTL